MTVSWFLRVMLMQVQGTFVKPRFMNISCLLKNNFGKPENSSGAEQFKLEFYTFSTHDRRNVD